MKPLQVQNIKKTYEMFVCPKCNWKTSWETIKKPVGYSEIFFYCTKCDGFEFKVAFYTINPIKSTLKI